MNIKDLAGTIVAVGAAATLIGTVVYKTGWVVGESGAQEIAQQKANEVHKELLVVQQQLYVELEKDDKEQLETDIQILMLQVEGMESKPEAERSHYETVQLGIWKQQLEIKQKQALADDQPVPP